MVVITLKLGDQLIIMPEQRYNSLLQGITFVSAENKSYTQVIIQDWGIFTVKDFSIQQLTDLAQIDISAFFSLVIEAGLSFSYFFAQRPTAMDNLFARKATNNK